MRPWATGQARRTPAGTPAAPHRPAPGRDRRPPRRLQEQRLALGPRRPVRAPRPRPGSPPRPQRPAAPPQAEIDRLVEEGRDRIGRLTDREFLVAGVALYAGRGARRDGEVRFANSDPQMVFLLWLATTVLRDRRIAATDPSLSARGLDLAAAVAFWSEVTGIPSRSSESRIARCRTPRSATKHVNGCVTSVTVAAQPTGASWGWSVRYSRTAPPLRGRLNRQSSGPAIPLSSRVRVSPPERSRERTGSSHGGCGRCQSSLARPRHLVDVQAPPGVGLQGRQLDPPTRVGVVVERG